MKKFLQVIILAVLSSYQLMGQNNADVYKDEFKTDYIAPVRIMWKTDDSGKYINGIENLLKQGNRQADLSGNNLCYMKNEAGNKASFLLDFGKEIQGGIVIVTGQRTSKDIKIRIRLGESAGEAMAELGGKRNATNDHSLRDFEIALPWLGKIEIGNSGFRFARIDLLGSSSELSLKEISAKSVYRNIPYLGSFKCSDEMLNKIWLTGAYTVHLNMQEYLWDGIKRDRLVWAGDMNPEIMTINSVFGYNEVVPKSLDLCRDITKLPQWMNGISSYSLWWIINHYNWFMYNGNLEYLEGQKEYLTRLIEQIISKINDKNSEVLDGGRFLDWPSSGNEKAIHAGLQALMVTALKDASELCRYLDLPEYRIKCGYAVERLKKNVPEVNSSKQAAALMAIAGLMPADKADKDVIAAGGTKNFSTFYGYYMLEAEALAGNYKGAIDNIKEFWGAMLNYGATTFWEDFNMEWLNNAAPIDELVPAGKKDLHGDCGAYCYIGYRHSLCHGWASGPTAWLSKYVLGIIPVEPGFKKVKIEPHLGALSFAEGTFPTPYGVIKVTHTKQRNGKIVSEIVLPKGVERVN